MILEHLLLALAGLLCLVSLGGEGERGGGTKTNVSKLWRLSTVIEVNDTVNMIARGGNGVGDVPREKKAKAVRHERRQDWRHDTIEERGREAT